MPNRPLIAAIIVAAGTGERAGGAVQALPKQYRVVAGKPVLARAIEAYAQHPHVDLVLPIINAGHRLLFETLGPLPDKVRAPVIGGSNRQASVLAGLEALAAEQPDLVLIHDAARPFVTAEIIDGVVAALAGADAAVPVVPVTDTIKRSSDGRTVGATEDRRQLFAAQTPQGFRFATILNAHRRAATAGEFTDDAAIVEWAGIPVALTVGSAENIKLTTASDFDRAERLLGTTEMETRTGAGFDVHPFVPGDGVWLGGVRIPHSASLKGHSDADAALHALCDAIYGAIGEGDIGTHFPPSDAQWKDAPSSTFLKHAVSQVAKRNGRIVNLDMTIVCEAPRIGPHVAAMKEAIAAVCAISPSRIAIKATTSEQLGFTGRGEGLVAMATATVELPREN